MRARRTRLVRDRSGQMTVELAVTIPAMMALLGVMVNVLVFLGDCARFDRLAPEAVRVQAASPAYGCYGTSSKAAAVQAELEDAFSHQGNVSVSVSVQSAGRTEEGDVDVAGVVFDLLGGTESYRCQLCYRPWGFGDSFFGVTFSGIVHTKTFVVSGFDPAVVM